MLLHQDYLTAVWKFMATVIVFCEQERERKAPLIHLVCGGAEIINFIKSCVWLCYLERSALTYPFLFFSFSSSRILLIARVQQQCPPRSQFVPTVLKSGANCTGGASPRVLQVKLFDVLMVHEGDFLANASVGARWFHYLWLCSCELIQTCRVDNRAGK